MLPPMGIEPGTSCSPLSCLLDWANLASVEWGIFNFTLVGAQIDFETYDVRILKGTVLQAMLAQSSWHWSGSQKVPGSIPTRSNIFIEIFWSSL